MRSPLALAVALAVLAGCEPPVVAGDLREHDDEVTTETDKTESKDPEEKAKPKATPAKKEPRPATTTATPPATTTATPPVTTPPATPPVTTPPATPAAVAPNSCASTTTANACLDCCAKGHEAELDKLFAAQDAALCRPDRCASACDTTECAPQWSPANLICTGCKALHRSELTAASTAACGPGCNAVFQCEAASACADKP